MHGNQLFVVAVIVVVVVLMGKWLVSCRTSTDFQLFAIVAGSLLLGLVLKG